MQIMLNDVYDIQNPKTDMVRILAMLPDRKVVIISLKKKDTLPFEITLSELEEAIENGEANINLSYPPTIYLNPTEKQIESAERSWKIIGDFVKDEPDCYDPKIRSRFIAAKSRELNVQRNQIQRILYRYWSGGMSLYALYPRFEKRGGLGKPRTDTALLGRPVIYENNYKRIPIGETELKYIKKAISGHYTKHTKYSLRHAYNWMIKEYYTDSDTGLIVEEHPTETQFRYHSKQFVDIRKRVGSVKYNKDMRGITGSSRSEAMGPGDMYQIDATVGDIYLVSHMDQYAVVGRPELYFVTDVFSRMIVGFYVCLESASWENARAALLNTFRNKVELCKEHGVDIKQEDWPCSGLPRALLVDNGELISKASNSIISGLGITVKNTAAWRPDLKGIVESRFRLLNINVKAVLPGAVLPDFNERGGDDYRLDSTLNLTDFTKIIINFILNHNHRMMDKHPQPLPDVLAAHVPSIPIELWNWGIVNRTGVLRTMNMEDMSVALSQTANALVMERGIKFNNRHFECSTASKQNWFATARIKGSWKIDIAYRPCDMQKIYWLKGPHEYEVCVRTPDSIEQFPGETFEEIIWAQKQFSKQKASYADINLQSDVDSNRAVDNIIKEAKARKKVLSYTASKNKAKPGQIRKNRKAENEWLKKQKQAAETGTSSDTQHGTPPATLAGTSDYEDIFAGFHDEESEE